MKPIRSDIHGLLRHLGVPDLSYVEVRADERAARARGAMPIPLSVPAQRIDRARRLRWTIAVAPCAPRAGSTTVAMLLSRLLARGQALGAEVVDVSAPGAPAERALATADALLVVTRADAAAVARVGPVERRIAGLRRGAPARWVLNGFDAGEAAQRSGASALRGLLGTRLVATPLHRDDAVAAALRAGQGGEDEWTQQSQLWADAEALAAVVLEARDAPGDAPWWR